MDRPPPMTEIVRAVERRWREHPVADGFVLVEVGARGDELEVAFTWRRDPQRYLVRFAYPASVRDALGDRFTAEQASGELALSLEEGLHTGLPLNGRRVRIDDAILLVPQPPSRGEWFVGRVPLLGPSDPPAGSGVLWTSYHAPTVPIARPGRFLEISGLDATAGRAAVRNGSLIAWLQVSRGRAGDRAAGQAVVVRDEDGAAALQIESLPAAASAFGALVAAACREAVEDGARRVAAAPDDRLAAFGFRELDGRRVARFDEIRYPAGS